MSMHPQVTIEVNVNYLDLIGHYEHFLYLMIDL